jgi:hypothetical protein
MPRRPPQERHPLIIPSQQVVLSEWSSNTRKRQPRRPASLIAPVIFTLEAGALVLLGPLDLLL